MFFACISQKDKNIIASVNDKDLFFSDVVSLIPDQTEDSLYFIERFKDNWIRKELLLSYAKMNLSADFLDYEEEIENYKSSLLIYAYQQQLLNQNFDTLIDFSNISNYYEQYKNEFRLNKSVFKGRFIVVDKLAPELDVLNKLYKSEKEIDIDNLEDYCQQFSKIYYLDCNKWQYFSVFNMKLPQFIEDEESFLVNNKGVWFEDESFRYYIFVKDYQLRGSVSPLDIEKDKIKNVLLNKKKVEYLKELENELYQAGLSNKTIKIY